MSTQDKKFHKEQVTTHFVKSYGTSILIIWEKDSDCEQIEQTDQVSGIVGR